MKKSTLIFQTSLMLLSIISLVGCNDDEPYTITSYRSIMVHRNELSIPADYITPQPINNPGKIYIKDEFVYITESDSGIHIINNTTPSSPQVIGFIELQGTHNIAIKGDLLYADSFFDLVVLDISDKNNITEVSRFKNAFNQSMFNDQFIYLYDNQDSIYVGSKTYEREVSYAEWLNYNQQARYDYVNEGGGLAQDASGDVGTGGSLARYTIAGNYLYTVSDHEMDIFDISNEIVTKADSIDLGWGIETIFPYKDLLFLGSMNGMHIYDRSTPTSPKHLSTYEHIVSCDPVVVKDDIAYVTLRSGTNCWNDINRLDVVDVSDPTNPTGMIEYAMLNPHGLGVIDNCLFVTEGEHGLKLFNIENPMKISENLIAHHRDLHAIDVIPLPDVLLVIGDDGLQQYEYDCTDKLEKISTLNL